MDLPSCSLERYLYLIKLTHIQLKIEVNVKLSFADYTEFVNRMHLTRVCKYCM